MQFLELKEMVFHAHHGVMEQERKVGNTYVLDLKIHFDFYKAVNTDNLNDSINYISIYELVKKEMAVPSHLIENIAGRIIRRIQIDFPKIKQIELRLAKKNPPFGGGDIKEVAVFIRK
ncbi:MAG: dihydroneopterin aldolase [Candidatus Azobacteroides pseudotrichonymphae]|jgi:dihydroneopterin aldolase|uniref:7,8-dihydroneopterin aldolase n=1 Tax=Azobacteroides pseudotrichonymphae genomovar. CFP2 TaxID=511995 RepID=B6YQ47_AZOPC|nr:dihydroneopterin aldolase [Candidatus Azobacteroides pseudotrichonymphae]MDR0530112.1 dihydroneopterin aldolase [Bacteroidales bacterium OttesenSCG-928-I14]BAG83319.1 dihydroneopterin aldolase [Candidatus Azobacteroides pseudotrichonymphae genomovar. CFP2]GMO37113.1 MAG: dihydroneopterin aldolase [Candidatus Azobacteroides pseudotrichonymphae]